MAADDDWEMVFPEDAKDDDASSYDMLDFSSDDEVPGTPPPAVPQPVANLPTTQQKHAAGASSSSADLDPRRLCDYIGREHVSKAISCLYLMKASPKQVPEMTRMLEEACHTHGPEMTIRHLLHEDVLHYLINLARSVHWMTNHYLKIPKANEEPETFWQELMDSCSIIEGAGIPHGKLPVGLNGDRRIWKQKVVRFWTCCNPDRQTLDSRVPQNDAAYVSYVKGQFWTYELSCRITRHQSVYSMPTELAPLIRHLSIYPFLQLLPVMTAHTMLTNARLANLDERESFLTSYALMALKSIELGAMLWGRNLCKLRCNMRCAHLKGWKEMYEALDGLYQPPRLHDLVANGDGWFIPGGSSGPANDVSTTFEGLTLEP